jgi:hypothetical protein
MATALQIEANRRNAQLSTGPRTSPGKARSALNALRHGVTGQVSIMPEEDRVAHDAFCREIIDGFKTETPLELQLASLIAEDFWRLQRIRALENDIFALGHFSEAAAIDTEDAEVHSSLTRAQVFLDRSKELERLTLYEQRINRALDKNRKQLEELQAERVRQREQALEQARLLRQLAGAKQLAQAGNPADVVLAHQYEPYDPAAHAAEIGFVFSSDEIERALDHKYRLEQARAWEKSKWNPSEKTRQRCEAVWELTQVSRKAGN